VCPLNIKSERDYVPAFRDICDGYLSEQDIHVEM
jgi:hypothetical protein